RTTAFPTLRLAVKPTRTAAVATSDGRSAACTINAGRAARLRAAATRKKSARVFSLARPDMSDNDAGAARLPVRGAVVLKPTGACGPSRAALTAHAALQGWRCAHGTRVGACGQACWAGKCASRHLLRRRIADLAERAV